MGNVDTQRIEAVRTLERSGYAFTGVEWVRPETVAPEASPLIADVDAMHTLLVLRADKLAGGTEGSAEEAELALIADPIERYEGKRRLDGKVPDGKG